MLLVVFEPVVREIIGSCYDGLSVENKGLDVDAPVSAITWRLNPEIASVVEQLLDTSRLPGAG